MILEERKWIEEEKQQKGKQHKGIWIMQQRDREREIEGE
jgi:hypothetical protein